MKNIIFTAAICLLSAEAFAAQNVSGFNTDFSQDITAAAATIEAAPAAIPEPGEPVKAVKKTGSYVQISGRVRLSGNFWVKETQEFTNLSLSGWGTFRDSTGRITSNSTHVTASSFLWLRPNEFMFETMRPNISVQLYRNGKSIGSVNLSGTVYIREFLRPGFTMLNADGDFSGSIYVEDEE